MLNCRGGMERGRGRMHGEQDYQQNGRRPRASASPTGSPRDLSPPACRVKHKSSEVETKKKKPAGKYDLIYWKYAELRDVINHSNDIDLLTACRAEIQRRQQLYRQLKEENKQQPPACPSTAVPQYCVGSYRFFRVRLGRAGWHAGWWLAQFDGPLVARQMELHDHKPPVLLIAGRDDGQMYPMLLEQTGLTNKPGAEITAAEFEAEWCENGGPPYPPPPPNQHN